MPLSLRCVLDKPSISGIFYFMVHYENSSLENIILEDGKEEQWEFIKGYEGLYMVSDLGRIKTIERPDLETGGGNYYRENKIKKQGNGTSGYWVMTLCKDKIKKTIMVHRVVAETFLDNPLGKRCVNHINGIKKDNRLVNLEWATHSENNYHAFKMGLMKNAKGADCKMSKKVKQLTIDGELVNIYPSITDAAKAIGCYGTAISDVCHKNKYNKTCRGFKWEFA